MELLNNTRLLLDVSTREIPRGQGIPAARGLVRVSLLFPDTLNYPELGLNTRDWQEFELHGVKS